MILRAGFRRLAIFYAQWSASSVSAVTGCSDYYRIPRQERAMFSIGKENPPAIPTAASGLIFRKER
jgi:hypothetical protein